MLAVIVELAKRVAERSPPEKSTSTASAFAMSINLSVIAFTSSREYIGDAWMTATSRRGVRKATTSMRGAASGGSPAGGERRSAPPHVRSVEDRPAAPDATG